MKCQLSREATFASGQARPQAYLQAVPLKRERIPMHGLKMLILSTGSRNWALAHRLCRPVYGICIGSQVEDLTMVVTTLVSRTNQLINIYLLNYFTNMPNYDIKKGYYCDPRIPGYRLKGYKSTSLSYFFLKKKEEEKGKKKKKM